MLWAHCSNAWDPFFRNGSISGNPLLYPISCYTAPRCVVRCLWCIPRSICEKRYSSTPVTYIYMYMISCYIAPRYYRDVIMGAIASQITSLTIVYSTVYSDADQRKHQSPASLAFVWGIHRGPVNSPHKWPVMRKMFPFDDVIMVCCKSTVLLQALYYYTDLTLLQSFQPMAAQLLKKAALPLAKNFVTASCRSSNTGPWDLFVRNGTVWKAVGGNGARGSDITGWMWSKGVKYVIRWRESRATWGRIYRNRRKTLMMTSHTRDFYMKRLMYFIQWKM